MFWLISLLLPSSRRNTDGQPLDHFSHLIKSPESRGLLFKILAILGAAGLLWFLIATLLSLINAWVVVALAIVMAGIVATRQWQIRRRENWIHQGCCAQCGYDLRATPEICPECGRDARLDEPTWRRIRRELEAKLLSTTAVETPPAVAAPQLPSNGQPKT